MSRDSYKGIPYQIFIMCGGGGKGVYIKVGVQAEGEGL